MTTPKQLMTILSKIGITDEERHSLVFEWTGGRTASTRDLTDNERQELYAILNQRIEKVQTEKAKTLDKKRKRVIASIFGLMTKMNRKVSMDYVKGVACKAAKTDDFNKIPPARLDSLYNAFTTAQKDLNFSKRMAEGWICEQTSYN